ncbi:phage head closure protein [Allofustis seminis]|uniref:phage head closure protein n=1 Tax=Allofustis seminis TaxID=166939 RepID=UPI000368760E|nr:phage head closure protein [Allofustis seminis]
MKINKLRVRIQIQKDRPIQDAMGVYTSNWRDFYHCRASVDSRGQAGGEMQVAGMTVDHSDLIFTIRYAPRLASLTTNDYRIVFKGDIYDIKGIDFMNYEKKAIKLYAKKVKR